MRRSATLLIPAVVVLLVGCSASPVSYERVSSGSADWEVLVLDPRFGSAPDACLQDASVDLAIQSADLPTSGLSIQLTSGSTESDALRVADCLADRLSSGDITVSSPAP